MSKLVDDFQQHTTQKILQESFDTVGALRGISVTAGGNEVNSDYPLPINIFTLTPDCIDLDFSISTFDGNIIDLFQSPEIVQTSTGSTNPKYVDIYIKRPIFASGITIGAKTGTFSNVKVEVFSLSGDVISYVDDSSNNTQYSYRSYVFAPVAFARFRMSFYTANTVSLGFMYVVKDVRVIVDGKASDPNNCSIANLASGSVFTGLPTRTDKVSGIQVALKTDQNCLIYVDQSSDGINWDLTDTFNYYSAVNNFGVTVHSMSAFVRVRVANVSIYPTTYFRLQTSLSPIVEPLPRSTTANGNLKTELFGITDNYSFSVENTPTDEMRVVTPVRVVGATFTGNVVDPNFWTVATGSGGSAVVSGSQLVVSTGVVANNSTVVQSVRTARYTGGSANRFRSIFRVPDTGSVNNIRRFGAFNTTDGTYFELSGTNLNLVTRKTGVNSVITNGSFNGNVGNTVVVDTFAHDWEIYYTEHRVWYIVDGNLLHTYTAASNTWTDNLHLPIRIENTNVSGSVTNVSLNVRGATLCKLGKELTTPTSRYQAGITSGVVLKYGPGNVHGISVTGVLNNSEVTLYDNIVASGSILWSSGVQFITNQSNNLPYSIDLKGLPFFTGLSLSIATANSNVTVIYE